MDEIKKDPEEEIFRMLNKHFNFDFDEIKSDSNFLTSLGMNWIDLLEIVHILEDDFKIEIKDEEFLKIQTISDLKNIVEKKLTKRA